MSYADMANELKSLLGLEREPVGIKFSRDNNGIDTGIYDIDTKTRYCQALMRAGKGEKVLITKENISCPASAAAFGLNPLPEMLVSGQMLFNMGLFASLEAGKKAMEGMTRLPQGKFKSVILSPLATIEVEPDVVVVESKPEHLMWIALASIYETGERLEFTSAIFQATCVDSTVIPFVTGNLNSTLGCYGCRDATDIAEDENYIGLPYSKLDPILINLRKIAEKPLKRARSKEAFHSFKVCGQ